MPKPDRDRLLKAVSLMQKLELLFLQLDRDGALAFGYMTLKILLPMFESFCEEEKIESVRVSKIVCENWSAIASANALSHSGYNVNYILNLMPDSDSTRSCYSSFATSYCAFLAYMLQYPDDAVDAAKALTELWDGLWGGIDEREKDLRDAHTDYYFSGVGLLLLSLMIRSWSYSAESTKKFAIDLLDMDVWPIISRRDNLAQ